ncbi:hypothetical protein OEZ86_009737 [Tetradesmus obliquus]|uniref:Uncharacterized protein n=2 Tax=Tetradesmus obliquus TaxID=3088 RepID=A0A383W5K4_TETOB|nr:hypothetical protein OEZ85_001180 [Tetradesmus obliquus]WIA43231.1 hypothetical protein OEZ86_009737 [Tetradesmus obliquus]|eukprot:jgi/Sobl393_1/10601/SZX72304.1
MSLLSSASSLSRSSSLQLPEAFAAPHAPAAAARTLAARPRLPPACSRLSRGRLSRSVVVRAEQNGNGERAAAVVAAVRSGWTRFTGRYDPVTTGVGSLLVTGYCVVVHGQEIGEALNIAAFATVLGMVMQEVLFGDAAKPENHA